MCNHFREITTSGTLVRDCTNSRGQTQIDACTSLINSRKSKGRDQAWNYNSRGIAYDNIGKNDLAIADYTNAIKSDSSYGWAYSNRAKRKHDRGDYESALLDFKTGLKKYKTGGDDYRKDDQASIVTIQKLLSTIRSLSDEKLCGAALAGSKQDWDQATRYSSHVKEAKKRGLDVERCRALIPLPQHPQVSTIVTSPLGFLQELPNSPLCGGALNPNKTAWETRATWTGHVMEAQRRGFSINQCRCGLGLRSELNVAAIPHA